MKTQYYSFVFVWRHNPILATLETILLTVGVVLLCYWIQPQDSLFFDGPFPWPVIVPALIAMRYGVLLGITSLLILFITGYSLNPEPLNMVAYNHSSYIVGSGFLVFVAGLFGSFWHNRLNRIENLNHFVQERLENLSRIYYITRLSHDRIEHQFITATTSIRSTFSELSKMLEAQHGNFDSHIARSFLEFISQHCSYDCAGLFRFEHQQLQSKPLAFVGNLFELDLKDELIQKACESWTVHYLAINELQHSHHSQYMAVIPLVTSDKKLLGMIVIKEIAFWSLNENSLTIASVLASFFADSLSDIHATLDLNQDDIQCPSSFAAMLYKLHHLLIRNQIDSSLVIIHIPKTTRSNFFIQELKQQCRSLDLIWHKEATNHDNIITLMPLSSSVAAVNYITRIKTWFKEEFNIDTKTLGITFNYTPLLKSGIKNTIDTLLANTSQRKHQ